MTKREEVWVVIKKACRGSKCICIKCYKYLLNFSLIHFIGRVFEWTLKALVRVSLGWVEWKKWKHDSEVNKNIFVIQIYINFFCSWVVLVNLVYITSTWVQTLSSRVSVNGVFQMGNSMFLCIVAFVWDGLAIHMDWPNTKGSDLKLYLSRFRFLNIYVWFYLWSK